MIDDNEWFSSEVEPRTDEEREFLMLLRLRSSDLARLGVRKPDTQAWMFADSDGIWMLLHLDVVSDTGAPVLRIDYGGGAVVGGLSPGRLNWDAEMRYTNCNVDMSDPNMRPVQASGSPPELAEIAAAWFLSNTAEFQRKS